ncbi:hypothetical protein GCM10020000_80480 [Streptomyces olivoverticillatus]
MTRRLPTNDEVRTAMNTVFREAADAGRRATVTAVERRLDIPHPTFYRNYPELIIWFKDQVIARKDAAVPRPRASAAKTTEERNAELRRENEDLRRRVKIYAEALRQLTLDYGELQAKVNERAGART